MGSIVKETVTRGGKQATRYRAHVRRTGFASQSKCFNTQAEAKAWLRNAESDAEQKMERASGIHRFSAVAATFAKTPPRKGTKFWEASHLEYWEGHFGSRDIKSISRGDINLALSELQSKKAERRTMDGQVKFTEKTISNATVNRYLASLSSVFNYAMNAGLIENHPMKGGKVSKLTEGNGRTRILTLEEEGKLIAEAERSTWTPMALFLRLALTTGARKSELRKLRWSDIDLERRIAVLQKTKNSTARTLPLVPTVRDALILAKKVQPLTSDYVFFDPKNPEKPKTIDTVWKHVRQRAGLEADREDVLDRVVLHSSRHTAATKLIRGGANLIQAASVTGHKTVSMLQKYTHLGADDVVALADRLLEQRK
jgi:integrase